MDERGLDTRLLVRQHLDRTDRVACPLEQILDGRAAQILPLAAERPVAYCNHFSSQWANTVRPYET